MARPALPLEGCARRDRAAARLDRRFDTGDHNAPVRHLVEAPTATKRADDRPLAMLVLAATSFITRCLDQLRAAEELGHLDAGCAIAAEAIRLADQAGYALSLDVIWIMLHELANDRSRHAAAELNDQLLTVARRSE